MGFLTNLIEERGKKKADETKFKAASLKALIADDQAPPEHKAMAMEELAKHAGLSKKEGDNFLKMVAMMTGGAEARPAGADDTASEVSRIASGADTGGPLPATPRPQPQPANVQPPATPAAPKKPSLLRDVGISALAGGLSGGKTAQYQLQQLGQDREQSRTLERDRQQSGIRTQEEVAREQRATARGRDPAQTEFDLQKEKALLKQQLSIQDENALLKQQLDIQDENADRELTRKLVRAEKLIKEQKMSKEEAYTTVGLPYKPQAVRPQLQRHVPDPNNPGKFILRSIDALSGQPIGESEEDTPPAGYKPEITSTKPKLTGQLKELADAHAILTGKDSTPEEKSAAQDFIKGVNARLQVVLNNPNLATPDDAKSIADAIETGLQPPLLTGLGRSGIAAKVRADLAKRGFNLAQAETDWRGTQRWIASLNSNQQLRLRQATEFSRESLDVLQGLSDDAEKKVTRSGKYPLFNRASMLSAKAGLEGTDAQDAATLLDNQITELRAELATVYKGGNSPTDIGIKQSMDILDSSWTHSSLAKAIELARKNLSIRLNSINATGVAGTSSANTYSGSGGSGSSGQPSADNTGAPSGSSEKLTATNPQTNEKLESTDGGKSWHKPQQQ